jgi:type I restriction enzyme S subunit
MRKVALKEVVSYSSERMPYDDLKIETYISTDNLLQNKQGLIQSSQLPAATINTPRYREGNILVSNIRPYLKKIYYAKHGGSVSSDVLTFVVKNSFDSRYVYYNLFQDAFFTHMMVGSKGTKMPRGDKNQILEFEIPNFDLLTQQKIATVLSALDDKIELNNRIKQSWRGWRS